MIRDATTAGLLLEQPLLARLSALIESAFPPFSTPLMMQRDPLPGCICKKAAKAVDESWQQTIRGHNAPTVTNPTVPEIDKGGSASQDDDDDYEPSFAPHRKSRLSAPQPKAQLSLFSDRTRLRRLKHSRRVCGQRPHTARLHHQRAKETRQQGSRRLWSMPSMWIIPGLSSPTR